MELGARQRLESRGSAIVVIGQTGSEPVVSRRWRYVTCYFIRINSCQYFPIFYPHTRLYTSSYISSYHYSAGW